MESASGNLDVPRQTRRFVRARRLLAAPVAAVIALAPLASNEGSPGSLLASFTPRSAHHAYGARLAEMRLARNPIAREWITAAERALLEPERVAAPFGTAGAFGAAAAAAVGYRFAMPAGRRFEVELEVESGEETHVFVDLYEAADERLRHVASAAPDPFGPGRPATRRIAFDSTLGGEYVLRVQPELHRDVSYALELTTRPLLEFPVAGHDVRAIQSGFGAERDGGARAHRGVDIFAPRGTPVLASVDGWVTRVETTARGGNVVWLQPLFGNVRLYYAHLDTQAVKRGDFVLAGDPLGTVGNTGNARTTPPHLHFGVYVRPRGMRGGAQDPWPFLTERAARR